MPKQNTGAGNNVFMYAPEVRAYITTYNGTSYDISNDIVGGTVNRVLNAASTFSLTLNNLDSRWEGKFGRMDRITIFLKRIAWVQVLSGYLSTVPVLDLYPTTIEITGHCTLKRLLYTYWNPGLPASANLLTQTLQSDQGTDAGMGTLLGNLLVKAGGWDPKTVHIQEIPSGFLDFAAKYMNTMPYDQAKAQVAQALGVNQGGGSGSGSGSDGFSGGIDPADARGLNAFVWAMGMHESQLNYTIHNQGGYSDASGAYQYLKSTWANYGGYPTAAQAPPDVQDRRMKEDSLRNFKKVKSWDIVATMHFTGHPVRPGSAEWNRSPGPGNPTVASYVADIRRLMAQYNATHPGSTTTATTGTAQDQVENAPKPGTTVKPPTSSSGSGSDQDRLDKIPKPNTTVAEEGKDSVGGNNETMRDPAPGAPKTSPYGWRVHPVLKTRKFHDGQDYALPTGTAVKATLSGAVKVAGQVSGSEGAGIHVVLIHNDNLSTEYLHLERVAVKVGQVVHQGSVIGYSDNTGRSTGPHLHYNVKSNGQYVNPIGQIGRSFPIKKMTGLPGATTGDTASGSGTVTDPTEVVFNWLYVSPKFDPFAVMFTGELRFKDQTPLINSVQSFANAGLRSFQSAPNGDFVAFFPDYFGTHGTTAKFRVQGIETKRVYIQANDDALATHVYTAGSASGAASTGIVDWLSGGIVSVEKDFVLKQLLNYSGDKASGKEIMERYGVRPLSVQFPVINSMSNSGQKLQFFQALSLFMRKWSEQYSTSVEITFMPEVYPGMRVEFAGYDLIVFVEAVSHNFDYSNGFTTNLSISAPSTTKGGIPDLVIGG